MTRTTSTFVTVALIGALLLLLSGQTAAQASKHNPYTGDPEAIEAGKALWLENGCYSCHGHDAEGAVGPDLTDDTWVYKPTDATLFRAIAKGRTGTNMVGWSHQIQPEDIWRIIAFLRSKYRGDPKKIIW